MDSLNIKIAKALGYTVRRDTNGEGRLCWRLINEDGKQEAVSYESEEKAYLAVCEEWSTDLRWAVALFTEQISFSPYWKAETDNILITLCQKHNISAEKLVTHWLNYQRSE